MTATTLVGMAKAAFAAGFKVADYYEEHPDEDMQHDFDEWWTSNPEAHQRVFPVGSDTVELITDGEGITAHCLVCEDHPVIGRWEEFTQLNFVLVALYEHQEQQRSSTSRTT